MWKRSFLQRRFDKPQQVVGVDYDNDGLFDQYYSPKTLQVIKGQRIFNYETINWSSAKKVFEDCIDEVASEDEEISEDKVITCSDKKKVDVGKIWIFKSTAQK